MADIGEFKNIHKGEEVAILANGPSFLETIEDLGNIDTIGINASLQHFQSKYHVVMDQESIVQIPEMKYGCQYLFTTNLPYKLPKVDCEVVNIPTRHQDIAWSDDLEDCIYTGKATVWFAAQLAAWMGYEDIYFIGLDLGGTRPEGHLLAGIPMPGIAVSRQLELMGYLRGLIDTEAISQKFYNCSQVSVCSSLPKVVFKHRHFTKSGVYEPAMDVDIKITRRSSRIGGGQLLRGEI